ncbi:HNH endonuclease [Halorhodospira halophila]|uniref:HNH endonuclease n=1 Tax=Halorhodospira halophila TaxID=1053 RepID=UPI0016503CA3|nr:HNH endonuclease [Halorhodospira halophila]
MSLNLVADLFVNGQRVGTAKARYQYQTWGGKRSPERRLTDNLGPLRNKAKKDDILLFTKDLDDDGYIQLHLIERGTPEYDAINTKIGSSRCGCLDLDNPPVESDEIEEAEKYLDRQVAETPFAFDENREIIEAKTVRKARDRAFRGKVLSLYDNRCAFTGRKFISPVGDNVLGLDAAHVIPVSRAGSDHPANGLPLTKDLHWAFDRGLIGVAPDRKILVPESVRDLPGNEFLVGLHTRPVTEPSDCNMRVMDEALEWHRENRLVE